MGKSIHHSETIFKMLKEINLTEKLTEVYLSHIITILIAIFSIGYRGKTVDFETHSEHHRTTIGHFLNKGKWDEVIIENILKQKVVDTIYEEAKHIGKPIFVIVDDKISSKTNPSSKAKHPIEDAYFHFSNLKKKQDYGHQAIAVMLCCNGITLNYAIACPKLNWCKKLLPNCLLFLSFLICFVTAGMYVTR